ncbi:MAG: ribonuclease III [Bacteroidaceae bacterium]|nr:ribonuclease III [Bacteroidaceae bacterium]
MFLPSNFIDRIKLPFRKDRELCASIYSILGFYPHHTKYYKQALLHKSSAHRRKGEAPEHNERLEYLGDAVLESIVSDILYRRYKHESEGFLTNTRSKLVQRDTLNKLSVEMGLDTLIRSNSKPNAHNSYMGGNAFEALMGAIYLDRGYDACMHFIRKRVLGQLISLEKVAAKEVNFKSKLIEWAQKHHVTLEFKLIDQRLENHNSPTFITRVILEGLDGETGKGYSKKESHQMAAKATLKTLKEDKDWRDAIFAAKERHLQEAKAAAEASIAEEEAETEADSNDTIINDNTSDTNTTDALTAVAATVPDDADSDVSLTPTTPES